MLDVSTFIFLSVILIGFGYAAGNAKSFNVWKLVLLAAFLLAFISAANLSKAHLFTMLGAFLLGYFLPYVHLLQFIGDGLSNLINAIRYRDAYEDIRRKEEEVEELRRQYEQARQEANQEKQEQARQKRQQESKNYRQSQKKKSGGQSKQKRQNQSDQHSSGSSSYSGYSSSSGSESSKSRYLRILDLDPSGSYSYADIKKAYRRQAAKYHPDKHHSKGADAVREMNEKFKEIKEAYEWLGLNGG